MDPWLSLPDIMESIVFVYLNIPFLLLITKSRLCYDIN